MSGVQSVRKLVDVPGKTCTCVPNSLFQILKISIRVCDIFSLVIRAQSRFSRLVGCIY